MSYREMDPTETRLLYMATSGRDNYISVDSDSSAPTRVDRSGFWPLRSTSSTKGSGWSKHRTAQSETMMDRVKQNFIVLVYVAVMVTIILLMMIGVL